MASNLPFNNLVLEGTTVTVSEFVYGAGTFREQPKLAQRVSTADYGRHQNIRSFDRIAQCVLYGDHSARASSGGIGTSVITLKYDSTTIFSGLGRVSTAYNDNNLTTEIIIRFDSALST